MIIDFFLGFLFGSAVSVFNYFLTLRLLGDWGLPSSEYKKKSRVTAAFFARYALNFLAMFLVYKNVPMLVGVAVGLTIVKNVLAIKYLIKRKG